MKVLGVNDCSHDAAVALVEERQILFAGHAERYSRKKNDFFLNDMLIEDALCFGVPEKIAYYENRTSKRFRKNSILDQSFPK